MFFVIEKLKILNLIFSVLLETAISKYRNYKTINAITDEITKSIQNFSLQHTKLNLEKAF